MDFQKIHTLMELLRMTEETVDGTRTYTITGANRELVISTIINELTTIKTTETV